MKWLRCSVVVHQGRPGRGAERECGRQARFVVGMPYEQRLVCGIHARSWKSWALVRLHGTPKPERSQPVTTVRRLDTRA